LLWTPDVKDVFWVGPVMAWVRTPDLEEVNEYCLEYYWIVIAALIALR